jgi:hypothetical protein
MNHDGILELRRNKHPPLLGSDTNRSTGRPTQSPHTESAVAVQRIAWAAGFVVGFPKVQCCCGLIAVNADDFEGGADLHRQLAASLGNSKGLIVTPALSCFGPAQPERPLRSTTR